jgi:hypothetical protein
MEMIDHGTGTSLRVPATEYPAGFVFYKMGKAGLLEGLPDDVDQSAFWELVIIDDDNRRRTFNEKYSKPIVLKFRHVPADFGRLIAKIGFGHTLTLVSRDEFDPICLPYIMGEKPNVSFVVGGTHQPQNPEPGIGYKLELGAYGTPDLLFLVALVRIYANTAAPAYHVVVGAVRGRDRVTGVRTKLRPELQEANDAHWLPSGLPIMRSRA